LRSTAVETPSRFGWTADVQRHAACIRLRPEYRERYLELHARVWPEVSSMLALANIRNYTIFLHGDTLFSYYEYVGTDHAADQARIAADPTTQRWWQLTDPCQERLPGTPEGQQWAPMTEICHLSP
jgi:L-rhamnose mutarotase